LINGRCRNGNLNGLLGNQRAQKNEGEREKSALDAGNYAGDVLANATSSLFIFSLPRARVVDDAKKMKNESGQRR
jgi:hypothetical protein